MWRTSRSREPSRRCERLEALKERHEKGLLTSVEFLKELLDLACDVVDPGSIPVWCEKSAEVRSVLAEATK